MAVKIEGVEKKSPGIRAGIKAQDILVSINGNNIKDVLDYMFYSAENYLDIEILRDDKPKQFKVLKGEYDDLGLLFDTFLMDEKKSCQNNCIFCFIDQMAPNMRETLYFKDDDARLSFLQGNYVTLTNLSGEDVDRIIKMRLGINVSVHTTNPELRCKMMNNRFAGEKLAYLQQLAAAGITMNCQIVLCPGINDGEELIRTLQDIHDLMPSIISIAVVPVGITKFRDGLFPLEQYEEQTARIVIEIIEEHQKSFMDEFGTRLVFASDEFYLKAKIPLPSGDKYEDYPQYENGVGLLRNLIDDFDSALSEINVDILPRNVSIVTGVAASENITKLVNKAKNKWENLNCKVYTIVNDFFGETINVTGLITGQDLIKQLQGQELFDELLIPSVMLNNDGIFLDDITILEVEEKLSIKTRLLGREGIDLLNALLGLKE